MKPYRLSGLQISGGEISRRFAEADRLEAGGFDPLDGKSIRRTSYASDTICATRSDAAGIHYLDAPISGGSIKAASGQLSIMAAGTPEAFAAARPLLDSIAETVFELGGSAMKAVNQLHWARKLWLISILAARRTPSNRSRHRWLVSMT
ncbi:NAD(P)-binding domain-containing protein [Microbulbifer sp. S227A]|uniref:NAD(P)-binding domain-containing protein n=1 Tax=Microbulbifer sp. S227A TaxID=3415131 RepID=UPI003C7A8496